MIMVITLILAYEADGWLMALLRIRPSGPLYYWWFFPTFSLVLAGILFGLAWFLLVRSGKDALLSWVFLVVGILTAFFNPLKFTLEKFVPVSLPRDLAGVMGDWLIVQVGAFMAVIGSAGLLRRK